MILICFLSLVKIFATINIDSSDDDIIFVAEVNAHGVHASIAELDQVNRNQNPATQSDDLAYNAITAEYVFPMQPDTIMTNQATQSDDLADNLVITIEDDIPMELDTVMALPVHQANDAELPELELSMKNLVRIFLDSDEYHSLIHSLISGPTTSLPDLLEIDGYMEQLDKILCPGFYQLIKKHDILTEGFLLNFLEIEIQRIRAASIHPSFEFYKRGTLKITVDSKLANPVSLKCRTPIDDEMNKYNDIRKHHRGIFNEFFKNSGYYSCRILKDWTALTDSTIEIELNEADNITIVDANKSIEQNSIQSRFYKLDNSKTFSLSPGLYRFKLVFSWLAPKDKILIVYKINLNSLENASPEISSQENPANENLLQYEEYKANALIDILFNYIIQFINVSGEENQNQSLQYKFTSFDHVINPVFEYFKLPFINMVLRHKLFKMITENDCYHPHTSKILFFFNYYTAKLRNESSEERIFQNTDLKIDLLRKNVRAEQELNIKFESLINEKPFKNLLVSTMTELARQEVNNFTIADKNLSAFLSYRVLDDSSRQFIGFEAKILKMYFLHQIFNNFFGDQQYSGLKAFNGVENISIIPRLVN